ncbi:N-acetyltransferase family protein [Sphingomonas sp. HT-1]|uniref:GNAT family N-acetyltransferase n=1 Tax=unclassified Sphingomonas TaxID=196159 RepID=UPI0002FDA501|nr:MULTISPECIES: GNAT family N-acetyltransferase [unclassified Sphingomonas]KTF68546.1 GCN5 family acetyltransferase [Sphingomonas sp. WG]
MTATTAEPVQLPTRSGLVIDVRTVRPDDEAGLTRFFDHVSNEDRRFRFFTASPHLQPHQAAALINVDHHQTESYLAFTAEGELVASAMLACDATMETAEVAISIRADRKGQGIGWSLLHYLTGEAKARGVKRLQSIESRENHLAIELEREMGFVAHAVEGDPSVVLLEVRF